MTKKDYVSIAKVLAAIEPFEQRKEITLRMSEIMLADNPRFALGKFLRACSVVKIEHHQDQFTATL